MRQRTLAIGPAGPAGAVWNQAVASIPWPGGFGFGAAAEDDFEAEVAETADVVGDLAAGVGAAFVVVRAEVDVAHAGVSQQLEAFSWVLPTATQASAVPRLRASRR